MCKNSRKQQLPALQKNKATAEYQNAKRKDYESGVGDRALLSTRYFKPPEDNERRKKLAATFAGTYEIIQDVSPVAYKLSLPPDTNAHPVFHARLQGTETVFPRRNGTPNSRITRTSSSQSEYLDSGTKYEIRPST
jgi:hypothetical protein